MKKRYLFQVLVCLAGCTLLSGCQGGWFFTIYNNTHQKIDILAPDQTTVYLGSVEPDTSSGKATCYSYTPYFKIKMGSKSQDYIFAVKSVPEKYYVKTFASGGLRIQLEKDGAYAIEPDAKPPLSREQLKSRAFLIKPTTSRKEP